MIVIKISIGTYNTRACDCSSSIKTIAEDITRHNLDIVALQELDMFTNRSGEVNQIKELSNHTNLQHYEFIKTIDFQGGMYGIGILSRFPIINYQVFPFDNILEIENRVVAKFHIKMNNTSIHFFNTHLSFEKEEIRNAQLKKLYDLLTKTEKSILAGDFNISNYSELDCFNHSFLLANSKNKPFDTFKTNKEMFKGIDNIIVSKEFNLLNSYMVETIASDHHLLIADIEIS